MLRIRDVKDKALLPFYRFYSGRNMLTVQEKEIILDKLVSANAVTKAPRAAKMLTLRIKAFVSVGILLLALPSAYLLSTAFREEAFTEKGGESPLFAVRCIEEDMSNRCPVGGTLAFKVIPPDDSLYFSVFAVNKETGKVVWYYPKSEDDVSVYLDNNHQQHILNDGIRIGQEHPLGHYTAYGIFSGKPLKRHFIRKSFESSPENRSRDMTVLEKTFEVK